MAPVQLVVAKGQHQNDRLFGQPGCQVGQQLSGRFVGPVQVLDDRDHRLPGAEPAQATQHPVEQPGRGADWRLAANGTELWHQPAELNTDRAQDIVHVRWRNLRHDAAQQVGDRGQWQHQLAVLDAPTDHHHGTRLPRAGGQLGDEPGLSDARLAGNEHHTAVPAGGIGEHLVEQGELPAPADELRRAHMPSHGAHPPIVDAGGSRTSTAIPQSCASYLRSAGSVGTTPG